MLTDLLEHNKVWASERVRKNPDYSNVFRRYNILNISGSVAPTAGFLPT